MHWIEVFLNEQMKWATLAYCKLSNAFVYMLSTDGCADVPVQHISIEIKNLCNSLLDIWDHIIGCYCIFFKTR